MSVQLHLGDCLTVMATLEANSIDSIVTDPPYMIDFMGKAFDTSKDNIAARPELWAEALRVAKPGAHLLAFGSPRTHHRLMCAIEDAGWVLRDMLMFLHGQGFPKGHSQLKPAWEPIIMARKPLIGTVAQNTLEWGTGGINVDKCRIPTDDVLSFGSRELGDGIKFGKCKPTTEGIQNPQGRWPANLCLDEDAAALLDEMSGELGTGGPSTSKKSNSYFNGLGPAEYMPKRDKGGGASRYFYCAKSSRRDRDEGLEGMELRKVETMNGYVHPSEGRTADKNGGPKANFHPTVKPTSLMRWLVRLVTPPGGTVLDPFLGSGSTLKAAVLEGFNGVGIELEAEYLAIAQARCAHAALQVESQIDPQLPLLEVA